ncbi:GldM family protein [Sediminibacterium goheungense]|uniref:Gliding motility-associated protein GldM C-terminal domain-containing protein n=1 Tax=Sediminibacterium goheungense TaxID=1086393 RepID=A0A4R6IWF8_9BACT|nr:GldM family protein [Sediminibacterium goheungense]TDO27032.1 hypothetical protein BC659_2348 [Sediminibacterium goheungense]
MAGKINHNRYRLITLLYVIFVCLSVLNIPFSLLDSNLYLIRTMEQQEQDRLLQVNFANRVISTHREQLNGDTTQSYLRIKDRINDSYKWADSLDQLILNGLKKEGSSIESEFSSKRKIGDLMQKDSLIYRFREELFDLNKYILAQPFFLDSSYSRLLPARENLVAQSGKAIRWESYFFLHKPTAINYTQVKRIKLLLLDLVYNYQLAALRSIDYYPAFYSRKENRVFIDKREGAMEFSENKQLKEQTITQRVSTPSSAVNEFGQAAEEKRKESETNLKESSSKENLEQIYQAIFSSLQTENLFVGIRNVVLKNMSPLLQSQVSVSMSPQTDLQQSGDDYIVLFSRSGDYRLSFIDKREGATNGKVLFEKRIHASLLPSPIIRLNTESSTKDILSVRDLFSLNRLVATMDIAGQSSFPGRINGFRLTRIAKSGEQQTAYNYGEVFRGQVQEMLSSLKKGDIVFFDNITISLADGTTRTPNPILYKIVE